MKNHYNRVPDFFRCMFTEMLNISNVLKRVFEMHDFSEFGVSANCDACLRLLKSQLEGNLQCFSRNYNKSQRKLNILEMQFLTTSPMQF